MNNIKMNISTLLKDLGISPAYYGYHYLRSAIEFSINDTPISLSLTKELYPRVAKSYGVSATRVERAIRHSIEEGWLRGNVATQMILFGYTVSESRGKPTNGEFIATLVDYLNTTREVEHVEAC